MLEIEWLRGIRGVEGRPYLGIDSGIMASFVGCTTMSFARESEFPTKLITDEIWSKF